MVPSDGFNLEAMQSRDRRVISSRDPPFTPAGCLRSPGDTSHKGAQFAPERVQKGANMLLLLILLIVLLFATVPAWPYSRGWGYYPSGGVGLVVLIIVILLLMGRI
jgi:hypothetical protein